MLRWNGVEGVQRTVLVDEAEDLFRQGLFAAWLVQLRDVEGFEARIFNCYIGVKPLAGSREQITYEFPSSPEHIRMWEGHLFFEWAT